MVAKAWRKKVQTREQPRLTNDYGYDKTRILEFFLLPFSLSLSFSFPLLFYDVNLFPSFFSFTVEKDRVEDLWNFLLRVRIYFEQIDLYFFPYNEN